MRIPDRIETGRLVLRHWQENDEPALSAAIAANLEHLRPWMPWIAGEPDTPEQRRARIRRWRREWETGGDSHYGMFLDGDVVGAAGLHRRIGPGGLEIGYWVDSRHLRRGYAAEAAEALTTAAFTLPDIERVEIRHDSANVASAGVPRRLGFTNAGEYVREVEAPAESGIATRWVMLRTDWRATAEADAAPPL